MKKVLKIALLAACLAGSATVSYLLMSAKPSRKPALTVESTLLGSIVRLTAGGHTFCSGTVVNKHTIVTAAHCVSANTPFGLMVIQEPISIRDNDNVELGVEAVPSFIDPQTDHAILRGDFSKFHTRELITDPTKLTAIIETAIRPTFITCGYPLGGSLYCTESKFLNRYIFFWAVSGTLLPGMSGGPTMVDGAVVGTNYAVQDQFAIISPTYNMLDSLIEANKEKK